MFDYRGIEALYSVIELQSFEKAAKKLYITQSAVSQRIKGLETQHGEPLLIRTHPYSATRLGAYLIGHYKQVALLEEGLKRQLGGEKGKTCFSIAINRDSLETWFYDLLGESDLFGEVQLEIIADDQEKTLDYLKKGLVSAALSTSSREIVGGKIAFLGNMDYWLVASPSFAKHYFSHANAKKALRNAPELRFDANDTLHERYLEAHYGILGADLTYITIPSVRGFKRSALLGYGYGLIPRIDIEEELSVGTLIPIYKKAVWEVPLYWHFFAIDSPAYIQRNRQLIEKTQQLLQHKKKLYG